MGKYGANRIMEVFFKTTNSKKAKKIINKASEKMLEIMYKSLRDKNYNYLVDDNIKIYTKGINKDDFDDRRVILKSGYNKNHVKDFINSLVFEHQEN
jgi:hypothetical protein